MSSNFPNSRLAQISPGSRVQGEFVVRERIERTTSAGAPFVILRLYNADGQIETAPVWQERLSWVDGAQTGTVVQVVGDATLYDRGSAGLPPRLQVTISAPVRVLPRDLYDSYHFLPTLGDTTRYWDWIDKQRAELKNPVLRSVVDLFFGSDEFRLRFEKTPGNISKDPNSRASHETLGGLLQHTCEISAIARSAARTMRAREDLTIAASLLHDIGKVEAYEVREGDFTLTSAGHLLGPAVIGAQMIGAQMIGAQMSGAQMSAAQTVASAAPDPSWAPSSASPQKELNYHHLIQHIILSMQPDQDGKHLTEPLIPEARIIYFADRISMNSAS